MSGRGEAGSRSFGYQPALDGVRAVAVALVLAFHGGVAVLGDGYLGVSVFFTLSGYLITSLLWRIMVVGDSTAMATANGLLAWAEGRDDVRLDVVATHRAAGSCAAGSGMPKPVASCRTTAPRCSTGSCPSTFASNHPTS